MKKYKSYLILGDYQFPYWTMIMGQLTIASTLLGVIGWAIYLLIDAIFFHKKPVWSLFKPDFDNWKPKRAKHQKLMRIAHGFEKDQVDEIINAFDMVTFRFFSK